MKSLVVYESGYGNFFVKGEEGPLEPGEGYRAQAWALHALGRPEEVIPGGGR